MNPSPNPQAQQEFFTRFSEMLVNPEALKTLERSYLRSQKELLEGLLELIDRRLKELDRVTPGAKRAARVPMGD